MGLSLKTDWNKLCFPRLCGLLALKPSLFSQAMHNAGFKALSLPFHYSAFDVVDTASALNAMKLLGMRGLSLSIPHKETALNLVDELSEESKKIGAVNTLINTGDKLLGFNTDWLGVVEALNESGFVAQGKRVLMLGAGGAARAGIYALQHLGIESITVVNRNAERGKQLAQDFGLIHLTTDEAYKYGSEFDLIINSTPVGSVQNQSETGFPLFNFSSSQIFFEMVTTLTPQQKHAQSCGAKTISGIRMLLHQATSQFKLFTEVEAPVKVLETALSEVL